MSMLTSSRIFGVILFGLAASVPGSRTGAFEGADGAMVQKAPLRTYTTPRAALRAGLEEFRSGDAASAIEALKYAADSGELLAQWKLAKIYASGEGVPRDDLKAYEYFSRIAANYDDDNPDRRDLAIISSAFVGLGIYSLNGIQNSKVAADPQRAHQLFQFAATNFGDANAQYNLGRMHLDGAGAGKDDVEALRWLTLAADKGHVQAQALLGKVLFAGRGGVRPQRARGLMWLTLAREKAGDSKGDKWIIDLYDNAMASVSDSDRTAALAYLESHLKRRN
ncbi:MAG: sel1 repeat family protein [Beijerinckiaceae bacterium]|nr:sel1 repeat family protein [Beijerinckiaceae bacterium]